MDSISVIALVLSIVAILLWVYSFFFRESVTPEPIKEQQKENHEVKSLPQVRNNEGLALSEEFLKHESQFMGETQKFSQMVRKNLEMLNTRVGIKFDVKPISDKYAKKKEGPDFVDSMEVSKERTSNMLPDESEENS